MTNEERESVIESMVIEEIRNIKAYCIVWIMDEKTKVCIYNRLPNPQFTRWIKNYYDKSLLNRCDKEIAMQILLDFTFGTSDRP